MAQRKPRKGHRDRRQRKPMDGNRIRVRGRRREAIDETKLALAYWLLAQQLAQDKTDPRQLTEDEVRKVADRLEDDDRQPRPGTGRGGAS